MNKTITAVMVRQFFAIFQNTFRKIVRQPLVLLLSCACVCLIGLLPIVVMFNFGEEGKLIRDGALAFHFVFGLALAVASAAAALRHEIKSRSLSILLAKPVSRHLFLLAAFLGILAVVIIFSIQAVAASLLSSAVSMQWTLDWRPVLLLYGALALSFGLAAAANAWFGKSFVSSAFLFLVPALLIALAGAALLPACEHFLGVDSCCATHAEHLSKQAIQWRIIPAGMLITMSLAVLASIAAAFSTRLPIAFTGAFCLILLLLGLVSDYYFAAARSSSVMAAICYALLPNWQDFWMVDALSEGGRIPCLYLAKAGAYASLYLSGVLCLALVSFRNVELK